MLNSRSPQPPGPASSAPPAHGIDPVLVEATRGPVVESLHRGAVAVCDRFGALLAAWGDVDRPVFPRSAVKPLQALPLLESGAADHFHLPDQEIALACASHGGEERPVQLVAGWLARLGLTPAHLECGAHAPGDPGAALQLAMAGQAPSPLHNNCSGKHAGMLTTALHLGEPLAGYIAADHPVQRRIAALLGELADSPVELTPQGIDGCGIPTFALPLSGIATALARLADPAELGATRDQAARRIRAAMTRHPDLVAGHGRLDALVMDCVPGLLVKSGAEGVYTAALPERGLGLALKIDDGAGRAAEVALLAVLRHLGALDAAQERNLRERAEPPLVNAAGRIVGHLRPAADWLSD